MSFLIGRGRYARETYPEPSRSGGGGKQPLIVRNVASPGGAILPTDEVIACDTTTGPIALTLPASSSGQWFWIVDEGGDASVNPITIFPPLGTTIRQGVSVSIATNFGDQQTVFKAAVNDWLAPVATGAAPAPAGAVYSYTLLNPVVVGDVVAISAANTVAPIVATRPSGPPFPGVTVNNPSGYSTAVGIVVALLAGNTCLVLDEGESSVFGGLTPGARYFVSPVTPGLITAAPPTSVGQIVQSVGVAKNATTLEIEIEEDFISL